MSNLYRNDLHLQIALVIVENRRLIHRLVDKIRKQATEKRTLLNSEMGAVADKLAALSITFAAKAGETGKLYGSITTQDLTNAIKAKSGIEVKKQQVDMQPLRSLGEHKAHVRLTMDLIPEIKIVVYREGESEPGPEADAAASSSKATPEPKAEKATSEA